MTCNTATYRFWDIHFLEGQNFRFWGSLGCTAPKGTDMYHHANFHADWHEMSIPKQKVITFPYRGLLSGPPSHAMHFRKLPCCWTDFKQSSCNSLTKGSVFDVFSFLKGQNFGFWTSPRGTTPKGKKTCIWDGCVPSCKFSCWLAWGFWGSLEVLPPKEEKTHLGHVYHHAEFYTHWCHHRHGICNQKTVHRNGTPWGYRPILNIFKKLPSSWF